MNEITELLTQVNARLIQIEKRLSVGSDRSASFNKERYTVAEAAELLGKRPFTIREWCRLKRIHAEKRRCGRGRTSEWVIARSEIERYMNDGLLPIDGFDL